jgi:hypothetical protein
MQLSDLQLAEDFILHTSENIFITGNAGTGKTTLLKKVVASTYKNMVVAAPTGVAAIHAGGVTLHSLLHLPATAFLPSFEECNPAQFSNRHLLLRHLKLSKEKITLLRHLETLIVDEASMVRSDCLDAIDFVLQTVRKIPKPFGGVQLVMIGDLFQLPPVMPEQEWEILKQHYYSPYFFDSLVWSKADAVCVELKEIYRQKDQRFIRLLNNIRNCCPDEEDWQLLSQRYDPAFDPPDEFILLTTHNHKADRVNFKKLERLPGKSCRYMAEVEGDFPESLYPCDRELILKKGARVMFIRNDTSDGLYYNGLTGTVVSLGQDQLLVQTDEGRELKVKKHTWENVRYYTDNNTGRIGKQQAGSFRQYPLRLAWAVTIHKSQGLTFDRVVIDAERSFAPGQVYVALSRCRSLDGIVLLSPLFPDRLFTDAHVLSFTNRRFTSPDLPGRLRKACEEYALHSLLRLFSFENMEEALHRWADHLRTDHSFSGQIKELPETLKHRLEELHQVADKFKHQLKRLVPSALLDPAYQAVLKERCSRAIGYFTEKLYHEFITPVNHYLDVIADKPRIKNLVRPAMELNQCVWQMIRAMYQAQCNGMKLYEGEIRFHYERTTIEKRFTGGKKREKGSSLNDTLSLFRQGKSPEEIATLRHLSCSTVKGHLARLVRMNEVDILDVLPRDTVALIVNAIKKADSREISAIRRHLISEVAYQDIRLVISWLEAGGRLNA